ncbi:MULTISPECIES: aldehyde dehydrogenase family protein [Prauserella salsuginis group]|uniref:Aldehyde dehydrogenase family protein n=1 Tax=Prauserella salsuginis TaxID=387889 RepID=A0ABW6G0P9_9PSEU|nr:MULTISPECIES: aldehyde dehydrogenase family protein [Prauserella salsuginis group]MCR3721942.1 NADP-dependent aldehyde dehydrogenase [Prauserella flava]MCR3735948.1 NADP-dependent aldehyde dehydrogenase [Prauserella salsuginis]
MTVTSFNPRSGKAVTSVQETTAEQFSDILRAASTAAPALAATRPADRQRWLHAIADAFEARREELAELADRETALGSDRLTNEIARTSGQLRLYGDVAAEGSYLGVTLDEPTTDASGLVRVNRPIGPVAVFGASNFPFAFSVPGNDTAAAIAAGCPVVVKAHPAHVGLSMRQAEIVQAVLREQGAPEGAFGIVNGHQVGVDLVQASEIAAVAFTGSQDVGMRLWRLANERDVVIPVYAEMGTVNPVVVTGSAAKDITGVADGFVESFTLGHGQFCTKPGLLLAPAGSRAAEEVAGALRRAAPEPVMLTRAIAESVVAGIERLKDGGAHVVENLRPKTQGWTAPAAVLRADISALKRGSRLLEECFGAVVLVCEYRSDEELTDVLDELQGALAASIMTGPEDDDAHVGGLVSRLSRKVGRVACNQWPTGVGYTWAQQHGGPWPSTSVPSATSVGAYGLDRFVRPVAFQSAHDTWLPPEARSDNPWQLPRRINGRLVSSSGIAS